MVPLVPLGLKLAALFDVLLAGHKGRPGRRVIAAAKALVLRELPTLGEWAGHLVTPGRVADGVNDLRAWLKARVAGELGWLARLAARLPFVPAAGDVVDVVCDRLVAEENTLLAAVQAATAPPAAK